MNIHRPASIFPLLVLALGLLLPGCGGSPSQSAASAAPVATPPANGTLNVHLVADGQAPDFSHLNLLITGMAMQVGGVWNAVPLDALNPATPGSAAAPAYQSVDLLAANSAHPATLATNVAWPDGPNTGFYLSLASGATITLAADGSSHQLVTWPEQDALMGLPGSFSIPTGSTTDMWIALDLNLAVLQDPNVGAAYDFTPLAMRGYDKAATGSITGILVPATPGAAPMARVPVTAQLSEPLGQGGADVSFRTVLTDAAGNFTLDLLPLGYTWCVAAQPTVGAQVYTAASAGAIALAAPPLDAGACNLAFSPSAAPGMLNGLLTGTIPAGEEDTVTLTQTVTGDGPAWSFAVQSTVVAAGTFSFASVPPGTYNAILNRISYAAPEGIIGQQFTTAPFEILPGVPTIIHF